MKKVIGKYLFEIAVIFIGITASFLFEEWRQHREEDKRSLDVMKTMLIELERNDVFIADGDTTYFELNNAIQVLIDSGKVEESDAVEIAYWLLEGIGNYRLKDVSSYILGLSTNDQLSLLNRNNEIQKYLSYLQSLLSEHELVTKSITDYSSNNVWPILTKAGLEDKTIALQRGLTFDSDSVEQESLVNQKFITFDKEYQQHIKWTQLKILRLIHIDQAIHRQIGNIKRELNLAIEDN